MALYDLRQGCPPSHLFGFVLTLFMMSKWIIRQNSKKCLVSFMSLPLSGTRERCHAQQNNSTVSFTPCNFMDQKKGLFSMKISVSTYAYILPIVHISIPLMLPPLVNASIVEEFTLPLLQPFSLMRLSIQRFTWIRPTTTGRIPHVAFLKLSQPRSFLNLCYHALVSLRLGSSQCTDPQFCPFSPTQWIVSYSLPPDT